VAGRPAVAIVPRWDAPFEAQGKAVLHPYKLYPMACAAAFGPNPQIRYYQDAIKFDGGMT
jgi:hypothetical protein